MFTNSFSPIAIGLLKSKDSVLTNIFLALCFAFFTAIGAQIQIPLGFTPVPITLQTFFVLSSGLFLGSRYGLLSQSFYLLFGIIGMPFFAGESSGIQILFGATGGYLMGFLLFSYFSGFIFENTKFIGLKISQQFLAFFLLSQVCIFLPGIALLKVSLDASWLKTLELGYFPFLAGNLLKIFACVTILNLYYKREDSNEESHSNGKCT